ncbi:MAG: SGNH/GDSL hydrolase family protein [Pseudotabrizicola sp.]|uniref:SGNH/GDSL hydrolase family protein n=1 Tax=Pseudotabrizicola sp. TaxID=2939647 RepID=UPI002730F4EE|nr:SGNH/GDSL hydrolase family protein [Pseudotabrizicola sp.]MDP2081392.1 SGNH/GDSL hydrolase family protein [Pseudotabrizicola sp.]MDZ7572905.1 SGNH/GDSL hydrolase family protein [Pseudotabrizicola sp.]
MKPWMVLGLLVLVAACGLTPPRSGGDILVIGDSVMAWNRSGGADIGSAIGTELNRDVVSRAALGARVRPGALGAIGRLGIPSQLSPGRWNWVVMNGGANDLGFNCGCTPCDDEIDALMSKDASTGSIPDLILTARSQGAQVLWVGYYAAPQSESFKGCRPGLVELERRIAAFASARQGVFFIDSEDVFDPNNAALFASDKTHPSPAGSGVIGRFIAREINARTPR